MILTSHRIAAAALCALAAGLARAAPAEEHVGIYAEKGDPARWYVPADTPRLKYETLVKETRAALAEAMKECRAMQGGRAACEAEARAQQRRDMEDARRVLGEAEAPARRR